MPTIERHVDGMSCSHCRAAVAGAIQGVPGVTGVSVDLLTETASIDFEGVLDEAAVSAAVDDAGYSIRP
ncbi:heavy-metal-associated domain-containing protein [Homoserinibacter sp. GY 40078]|uniref:heavy-metal-associated domain-containing protein n=1 Tax=Homoserinibacter sp. GY 40078 TaxID=2603275 RepID=UPI0011CB602E|nr:heavy-metal-associated domain-containing protein [Homoserinibacter sp. GY 40078]TXK18967.1 heavy-metal-associated domain-containing protein [Homoserinibacter sp. GY 40078]